MFYSLHRRLNPSAFSSLQFVIKRNFCTKEAISLNFDDTKEIYKNISTKDLKKSLRLLKLMRFPGVASLGPIAMEYLPKPLVKWGAKRTFYPHFCGGETVESTKSTIERINRNGQKACLDYSVEGATSDLSEESEKIMDNTNQIILDCIEFSGKFPNKGVPFAVIKITGVTNCKILEKISRIITFGRIHGLNEEYKALLPHCLRLDGLMDEYNPPRTPAFKMDQKPESLTEKEIISLERALQRLFEQSEACIKYSLPLLVDAEQSWYQDAIDHICMLLALKYNKKEPIIYTTYQMYLKDAMNRIKYDYEFIKRNNIIWGAKLVRGAYMHKERERAKKLGIEDPIHDGIENTHKSYFEAIEFILDRIDHIHLNIATHNQQSVEIAIEKMKKNNIPPNDPRVSFAQLHGMGDYISLALANAGYQINKYLPFGPVIEVVPFLSRRLKENGDVRASSIHEIMRLEKELKRRKNLN